MILSREMQMIYTVVTILAIFIDELELFDHVFYFAYHFFISSPVGV